MVSQREHIDVPPWLPRHRIGGHPALDLVNTVSHRYDASIAVDRMSDAGKITSWCADQGIVSVERSLALHEYILSKGLEAKLVASVARIRDAAGATLDPVASDGAPDPTALAQVLAASANAAVTVHGLSMDNRSGIELVSGDLDVKSVTAAMAMLVVDVVFRLPAERIRACPRCGWLFHDSSKGGRRRWCDMKRCGNREKVSRHYHAHQPSSVKRKSRDDGHRGP
jgi:predicted RNA-binding Zn ribbon-like protein